MGVGHELRTPLTSVRTNLFTLRHADGLPGGQRRRIIHDLTSETEELTALVNEVLDLATFRRGERTSSDIALGPVVDRVTRRASVRNGRDIRVRVDDSVVHSDPASLARAVSNLIENAVKFDPGGAVIDVDCSAGTVSVADR